MSKVHPNVAYISSVLCNLNNYFLQDPIEKVSEVIFDKDAKEDLIKHYIEKPSTWADSIVTKCDEIQNTDHLHFTFGDVNALIEAREFCRVQLSYLTKIRSTGFIALQQVEETLGKEHLAYLLLAPVQELSERYNTEQQSIYSRLTNKLILTLETISYSGKKLEITNHGANRMIQRIFGASHHQGDEEPYLVNAETNGFEIGFSKRIIREFLLTKTFQRLIETIPLSESRKFWEVSVNDSGATALIYDGRVITFYIRREHEDRTPRANIADKQSP